MSAGSATVDSNATGLAIAEETVGSPGTLPGTPIWDPLEPNSYGDFGPSVKTVARQTINNTRQKRKGVIVGLDVTAGFQVDFVTKSLYKITKGFMFSDWSEKDNLLPTAVTGTAYTVASGGAAFATGSLVFGEGFGVAGNNGLHVAGISTGTSVLAAGLTAEAAPPAGATITRVGFQAAAGDLVMTVAGGLAVLTSTVGIFTAMGVGVGEWVWIGGDVAATAFATAACNGFYRIASVSNTVLTFDRCPTVPTADTGTTKTIHVYCGHTNKNQAVAANRKFRTYSIERALTPTAVETVKGCGANTMAITAKTGDKVVVDFSFIGMSAITAGALGAGTRNALPAETSFTGTTSFSRLQLNNDTGNVALATYLTDLKVSIDNGITPNEALGTAVGAVDLNAGDFSVSATATAYFTTLAAVAAVKANVDASLNFGMVENVGGFATGYLFDLPYLMLGDGRNKVEKDKPITFNLSLDAAGHPTLNYTLLVMRYAFLPQLAI